MPSAPAESSGDLVPHAKEDAQPLAPFAPPLPLRARSKAPALDLPPENTTTLPSAPPELPSYATPPCGEGEGPRGPRTPSTLGKEALEGDLFVEFLRRHDFKVELRPTHSGIVGGLINGFDPAAVLKRTRVIFVENPEHVLPEGDISSWAYISEAALDKFTFERIRAAFPNSIRRVNRREVKPQVACIISTWVSFPPGRSSI